MTLYQWLGIPAALVIVGFVGFVVFAFRQGLKVKPDPNNKNDGPSVGGSGDWTHG